MSTSCWWIRIVVEDIHLYDEYVKFMTAVEEDATRSVVYMDEIYIHKNFHWHEDSLFDPNYEQYLETKAIYKGKLYYLIAAIIDADKTIHE